MKKLFLVSLAALLLLPSCAESPAPSAYDPGETGSDWVYLPSDDRVYEGSCRNFSSGLQAVGDYVYFDGGWGGYVVPARLNCTTGNVTWLCSDPLCAHDTPECSLYGTRDFLALDDGSILALRQYAVTEMTLSGLEVADRVHEIVRFEPDTRRRSVVEEFGDRLSLGPEVIVGNLRFCNSNVYDEEGSWVGGLERMDLSSGKTEQLFEGWYTLLFHRDGRVWVSDGVGFFSFEAEADSPVLRLELEGKSAILPEHTRFATEGTNLYITEHENNTVRVLPLDGGEERSLTIDFADYNYILYMTENWLYYFSGETTVLGKARVGGYASDRVELYGTEFRRCRPDGSEDERVFRFEGEYASFRPIDVAVAGRYLFCTYSWWEDPDGDGVYRDGDNRYSFPVNGHDNCSLLRIDCETGEAEIITIREGTK
ncbi:MAG: hypothetical protein E7576_03745 [Ruminococcaceae bacterium]|nr:hypothetical protein [Oscillospiraceae bacterium]